MSMKVKKNHTKQIGTITQTNSHHIKANQNDFWYQKKEKQYIES